MSLEVITQGHALLEKTLINIQKVVIHEIFNSQMLNPFFVHFLPFLESSRNKRI